MGIDAPSLVRVEGIEQIAPVRTPTDVLVAVPELALADQVARLGRCSVSPFVVGDDRQMMVLADGGIAGFVQQGRWAVLATGPVTPPGTEDAAVGELLDRIDGQGLRAVLAAVADPDRYRERGLRCHAIADDPMMDMAEFSLAGKRRASVRHSATSARRAGLHVEPYSPSCEPGCAAVSAAWLSTKRGGEMGFTLGRFDPVSMTRTDCRVALDGDGRVVGFVTWHRFDDGRGRVLDLMRRLPDAPNPTMDLLIVESLLSFAADGVERVSLGSVPRSNGRLAERIYPTRSLHRFKDKFAPTWEPRFLVAPSLARMPGAMVAVGRAYSSHGLWAALRPNA